MNDERLKELLRAAVPPASAEVPRDDVWPRLASRFEQHPGWSYFDLGLASAVGVALGLYPEWLWPLVYHL